MSPTSPREASLAPAPTFIACGARSGSTLLRWLLDSHPQVACPGESDIALTLTSHLRTATAFNSAAPAPDDAAAAAPPLEQARAAADALITAYLAAAGKSHLAEKSLSNALHLDALAAAWPQSRFVLLHRHCMDFVASGLAASPWGLNEYGFGEFAQRSPTDNVLALVAYWLDRTRRLLSFEERFPDRSLRLRYEDLVGDTDAQLARVCAHIGVAAPAADAAAQAFAAAHDPYGPADHKVWYTGAVHTSSLGAGARIPPQLVAGLVRDAVNELLERLAYESVSDFWGCGAFAPGAEASTTLSDAPGLAGAVVDLRILDGHAVRWQRVIDLDSPGFDAAPGPPSRIIVLERTALAALAAGNANIGAALRARTLRSYGRRTEHFAEERATFQRVAEFLRSAGDAFEDLI
jgi:hypothetical protein